MLGAVGVGKGESCCICLICWGFRWGVGVLPFVWFVVVLWGRSCWIWFDWGRQGVFLGLGVVAFFTCVAISLWEEFLLYV